ncbi:hypothetical protein [Streptantibioticus ferralitis]|uniref:Uncharacterized protein n=1 Tax=Streptantibioticus ferralitis TaxID=236510 RepID=A0ABT5ZBF4_9ACTN|nr:hypothetical protein [Streptantibioticus ferralitis]
MPLHEAMQGHPRAAATLAVLHPPSGRCTAAAPDTLSLSGPSPPAV